MKALLSVCIGLALSSVAIAQAQTVTTPGGTANKIAKFTSSTAIGDSAITESGGNVGIGTTPLFPFHLQQPGAGSTNLAAFLQPSLSNGNCSQILFGANSTNPYGAAVLQYNYNSTTPALSSLGLALSFSPQYQVYIVGNGNVGIGTSVPAAKLDVAGNVRISGTGSSITFPDNTVQSTAWTGSLCGGDYAESVGVNGDRAQYEPGDVLVIDANSSDGFAKSSEPYSTVVSGVYSTKPGVVGRRSTDPASAKSEIPMAVVGIVPTKVSVENGPIKRGDLLVTSSTLGYAMKGTDRARMLGALVGKALASLDVGTGVIDVLISLQ